MSEIKRVAVYAASSSQVSSEYIDAAAELGRTLAAEGIEIVYGAGKVGLMGALADAALDAGGKVTGVIPQFMVDNGWCREKLTNLIVTPDMHTRKEKIVSLADATIALPGGVGTLEELMEIITWKQLGLYADPIVILNTRGYFNPLKEMLERAVEEKFMREIHRNLWSIADTPRQAADLIRNTPQWDTAISKMAQM
ncbi:MAG: TIGR00730 family Rossman fold protein [Prevotellaceae bacterium]|nr:TIGR00730 family Rossman fold protein [Bacteroidaceae bacterium]MCI6518124.1 TIGR00730 family Rossman fold protein [Prevotellaceae bacterium]MDD7377408.1 TIGR00730 family Rossman fold protein [Prevotellaceae bacterium]MDY4759691.1 TIGR00730 family Rossman fold protein [Bacteroidaceae bacterium]PWL80849.1 MAG: TIGR00730 family Rossman fold protein [Prevotellaceae bacterium]